MDAWTVISYCFVAWRAPYAKLLLDDLVRKTTVPFEILVWLNTADPSLRQHIEQTPHVRIVGCTPNNEAGMVGLRDCFLQAQYPLVVQMDDDVIRISPQIAEICSDVMRRHPTIKQIIADVWQDETTDGARPSVNFFQLADPTDRLYDGPIDGWFSVVDRDSLFEVLPEIEFTQQYFFLGGIIKEKLGTRGKSCRLSSRIKVLHLTMSEYMTVFPGLIEGEIAKYRKIQVDLRLDLSTHIAKLEGLRQTARPVAELSAKLAQIYAQIDVHTDGHLMDGHVK